MTTLTWGVRVSSRDHQWQHFIAGPGKGLNSQRPLVGHVVHQHTVVATLQLPGEPGHPQVLRRVADAQRVAMSASEGERLAGFDDRAERTAAHRRLRVRHARPRHVSPWCSLPPLIKAGQREASEGTPARDFRRLQPAVLFMSLRRTEKP